MLGVIDCEVYVSIAGEVVVPFPAITHNSGPQLHILLNKLQEGVLVTLIIGTHLQAQLTRPPLHHPKNPNTIHFSPLVVFSAANLGFVDFDNLPLTS